MYVMLPHPRHGQLFVGVAAAYSYFVINGKKFKKVRYFHEKQPLFYLYCIIFCM